jgi:hypothetical protein
VSSSHRLSDVPGAGGLALCCEHRGADRHVRVSLLLAVTHRGHQMRTFLVLLTLLGFPGPVDSQQMDRLGPLGRRLSDDDVTAIARLVTSGEAKPWVLFGQYSQILPETWYVDAFLKPARSTQRLRRGVVRHLECKPAGSRKPCLSWHLLPETGSYVQVADGAVFGPVPTIRRPSERPIALDGNLTDADLLSLVQYIRSKPTPEVRDRSIALGVSGTYPIREIYQQKDGSLFVFMSLNGRVGETATVRRTKRGWQVTEVVGWVA